MSHSPVEPNHDTSEMRTERIKMHDGRYLIYYTFPQLRSTSEKDKDGQGTNDPATGDVDVRP